MNAPTPEQVFFDVMAEFPALAFFPFSVELAMVLLAKEILKDPGKSAGHVAGALTSPRGRIGIASTAYMITAKWTTL